MSVDEGLEVSMALTLTCTGAARREETAGFQQSVSGASAAGALMSVLWTRGCVGSGSARVLAAHPGSFTSGAIPLIPAWPLQVLAQGPQKSWFDDDLSRVHFRAAYCTRVGVYWSGVVRTARIPGPCGVHPTLCQWIPTLVQFGWCQV